VSLTIKAGETSAIVGISGAGKSNFADLIIGLILPQQVEVFIDGMPLQLEDLNE